MRAPPRRPRPEVAERAFHAWLARSLPAGREGLLPLGDDAAALHVPRGAVAVLSMDALIEGTHFKADASAERIGRTAVAVSLSDLAAKGARPAGALIALLLPPHTPRSWAAGVAKGAEREASRFGCHVIGGDTKPSPTRSVVGSVIGWASQRHLAPRSGARPGDALLTTGTTGRGGVAAARYERDPNARGAGDGLLKVDPRVPEGAALVTYAHAMIDTSDGLADAARLLAHASGVRLRLEAERIPWDPGLGSPRPEDGRWVRRAFYGGDYELLAAVPARLVRRAADAVGSAGGHLTVVGTVVRGKGALWAREGRSRPLPRATWQHFEDRARVA